MFAFGAQTDDGFVFVQGHDGHVYTFPDERRAREFFLAGVKVHSHLYQLLPDLSVAVLIEASNNPHLEANSAPAEVAPTEKQKHALWKSYVYKSLLTWAPFPEDVEWSPAETP